MLKFIVFKIITLCVFVLKVFSRWVYIEMNLIYLQKYLNTLINNRFYSVDFKLKKLVVKSDFTPFDCFRFRR